MIELEANVYWDGQKYTAILQTNMLYNLEIKTHAYDTPRFAAAKLARGLQAMGYRGRLDVYYVNHMWRWTLGEPQAELGTYLEMEIESNADVSV